MSDFIKKSSRLKLDYILLAVVMGIFYGRGQLNGFIGDPDGFYHAKIADFINQGIILQKLPWMQFSYLKDAFTDHHLLYHIIMAPFTNIINPLIGAKVATVFLAIVMVLVFYWLLKQFNIKYPLVFAMGFLLLNGLNFRLFLIKSNSLSFMVIWLLIYSIFKRKYWLLMLIGFIFVWSYGMWPLSFLILFVYFATDYLYKKIHVDKTKIFWNKIIHTFSNYRLIVQESYFKFFCYLSAGIVLGLVINPYWPQNIDFYIQLLVMGLGNGGRDFPVGSEWYGSNIGQIISAAPHVFAAGGIATIILFFNYRKVSKFTWFNFILTFLFLIMTAKSKRYIEYYSPFLLLFTASAITDILAFSSKKQVLKLWHSFSKILKTYIWIVATTALVLLMPSVYDKILNTKIYDKYTMDYFQGPAQWLEENTPENSIIFHTEWDEWPMLFYHNTHNYYIVGLDPNIIEHYDSQIHALYRNLTNGTIKENIPQSIQENFGANYIFIDKAGREEFIQDLISDQHAVEVYQDDKSMIFKII